MPLSHYIQVIIPVRGQLGGICQVKVKTVLDCVEKKPSTYIFFLKFRIQDYRVGRPPPNPCLCSLTPQSGSLVHFSSMKGPRWHHHAEVLNVVTFLRVLSTSFHSLDHSSFGPDTDTLCLYFCKIIMHGLMKLRVAADGYCC